MSRKEEYRKLAEVSEVELLRFGLLSHDMQLKVLEGMRRPASNPRIPKRDREVAEKRAQQFEAWMKQNAQEEESEK